MNRSDYRDALKYLLGQNFRANRRKDQLNGRLELLEAQMESPIGAIRCDRMPGGSGGGTDGAAALVLRKAEIEERIQEQKAQIARAIIRVMDLMDTLPINSLEREICELHHVELLSWQQVADVIPMSRSQVNRRYNAALDMMLADPFVIQMIEQSEEEYLNWAINRNIQDLRREQGSKKKSGGSNARKGSRKKQKKKSRSK